jgi:hypothetical protein
MSSVRTARLISCGSAAGPQAFSRAFETFHAQYAKETNDFEELSLAPARGTGVGAGFGVLAEFEARAGEVNLPDQPLLIRPYNESLLKHEP